MNYMEDFFSTLRGFFVSFNTGLDLPEVERDPRMALVRQFFDHYYPQAAPPAPQPARAAQNKVAQLAGVYRYTRYDHHTAGKFFPFPPNAFTQATISANDDGTLTLHYPFDLFKPSRWIPIEACLFQRDNGAAEYLAFRTDADGHPRFAFTNTIGDVPLALERIGWFETLHGQLGFMAFFVLAFLAIFLIESVGLLVDYSRKQPTWLQRPGVGSAGCRC